MKKNLLKNTLKATGILFFSIFLMTCKDVGLGTSVDTTAPTVTIDSPAASEITKGVLEFHGTADDDGVIKEVTVKIARTGMVSKSASNEDYEYTATVSNKEWKLSIDTINGTVNKNNKLCKIPDGTYSITVSVTDGSARTSTQATTFIVDNTPPVVIVTSPELRQDSMNYNLQFEGKIYDSTSIEEMTFVICDDAGNKLLEKAATLTGSGEWKVTFNGKNDLLIGVEGDTPKLSEGTYHYYLKAKDAAGSENTYFFHKADIYTDKFSPDSLEVSNWAIFDKGNEDDIADLIKHITNDGRNTSEWTKLDAEEVKNIRISIPAKSGAPSFAFSPAQLASVTFSNIDGIDTSSLNEGDAIVGSITPPVGVDAPFKNDTFKAYILTENDVKAKVTELTARAKTGEVVTIEDAMLAIVEERVAARTLSPRESTVSNIGTGRNFSISTETLKGGVANKLGGGSYYVYIQIENTSGKLFSAVEGFGISLSTPKLTVKDLPKPQEIINTYEFKIEGTALVSTGEHGCNLEYTLKKDDEDESSVRSINVEYDSGYWFLDIPDEDGTYVYTFTARSNKFNAQLQRTIIVDTNRPTAEIVSLSQNDNGTKVTANGTADDALSGLATIDYCLIEANKTPAASDWKPSGSSSLANWKLELNTSNYEEKDYKLYIKVTDAAGHSFTADKGITIDKSAPSLELTQNTEWVDKVLRTIRGTSSDTHFEKLTVTVNNGETQEISVNNNGVWEWVPAITTDGKSVTITADGVYTAVFEATDTVGKATKKTANFTYDKTAPEVEVTTIKDGDVTTSGGTVILDVKGSATDATSGLDKVFYKTKKTDDKYTEIRNVVKTWQTNLSELPEGENYIQVKAIDKAGNEKELTINFTTDYNLPTLNNDAFNTAPQYIKKDGSFSLIKADAAADLAIASDSVAISKLEISALKDGVAQSGTGRADGKWFVYEVPADTKKTTLLPADLAGIPAFAGAAPVGNADYGANDGSWTVTVAVYDKSGQKSEKTFSFTIDATLPVIHFQTPADGSYIEGSTVDIRGNIDEPEKGTGIESVTLTISGKKDGTVATETSSATVSGRDWSYTMKLRDYWDEGSVTVSATAKDRAGNESAVAAVESFTIDQNAPVAGPITIKVGGTETSSAWLKGNFEASGIVTDSLGLSKDDFTLTVKKDGVALTDVAPVTTKVSDTEYSWSYNIEAGSSGSYEIRVSANDLSGKYASDVVRNVYIDKDAPILTISNIGTNEILSNTSYIVRGTAIDKPDGTHAGVKSLEYRIDDGDWTAINVAENWTSTLTLGPDGIAEGNHTIEIRAEDDAENKATNVSASFMVDLSSPVITLADGITVPDYTNEPLVLSGTVTDTNPLSVGVNGAMTVKAYVNDEEKPIIYDRTAGTWSYTLPASADHSDDGLKTVRIVATDAAEKSSEISKSTTIDTTAPTVAPNNPGSVDGSFKLSATVFDGTGKGVAWVKYSFDNEATDSSWKNMSVIGNGKYETESIGKNDIGEEEGEKTIYIKSSDGLNTTDAQAVDFYYDFGNPEITETSIGSGAVTTNEAFSLSGFVYDTNALSLGEAVAIKSDNDVIDIKLALSNMTLVTADNYESLGATTDQIGQYKWIQLFSVGDGNENGAIHLNDGKYIFTITAKDVAGKITDLSRTISVDTTAPVFSPNTAGGTDYIDYTGTDSVDGTDGKTWRRTSVVTLAVVVSDEAGGSGLSTVGYATENGKTGSLTKAASGKWTASVPLDEGENKIYLTATDTAGNVCRYPAAQNGVLQFESIFVDTTAPAITADECDSLTNDTFTLSGTAADEGGSGIASVAVSVKKADGTPVAGTWTMTSGTTGGAWSITFNTAKAAVNAANKLADGTYNITIAATDKSGRESKVTKNVQIDTTAPSTLSISAPVDGTTGNVSLSGPSYDFRGTVKDNAGGAGMSKISYAFVKAGDGITATVAAPTEASAWTDVS
ncbi:MAG: hypothetical protein K5751_11645, partial [Treponemataceae bacterium]|nr:hypothetical protein [Treponemataceae bacterium]